MKWPQLLGTACATVWIAAYRRRSCPQFSMPAWSFAIPCANCRCPKQKLPRCAIWRGAGQTNRKMRRTKKFTDPAARAPVRETLGRIRATAQAFRAGDSNRRLNRPQAKRKGGATRVFQGKRQDTRSASRRRNLLLCDLPIQSGARMAKPVFATDCSICRLFQQRRIPRCRNRRLTMPSAVIPAHMNKANGCDV
jgi:hypothetical protein